MQDEFLVHTREGEPCPRCGGPIARIVVSGRSTYFCPSCQVRLRARAASRRPGRIAERSQVRPAVGNLGACPERRSRRRRSCCAASATARPTASSTSTRPTRGRIGAIAKGARKPRSRFGGRLEPFFRLDLILHEGRGELLTVTNVATVDGYPRLRSSGAGARRRRPRLRRGAAPARLAEAEPARLQPALPLPRRCSTTRRRGARGRRARDGARLPAEAGAGGRLRPRAGLLRALRRGRPPGRLLGRRGRGRLRRPARRAPSRSPRRRTASWSRRSRKPLAEAPAAEERGAAPGRARGRARRSSTTRTCSFAHPRAARGLSPAVLALPR